MTPYRDKRQELFTRYFEQGLTFDDYLKTGSETERGKWEMFKNKLSLNAEQQSVISNFKRKMPVLVLSGIWCGDCARQGPMIHAIELASKVLDVRFIENKKNPELQDELRINGAEKVPVIVALSEDFFEVERFGDRHLSVYRKKFASELGAACDAGILPPAGTELETELNEWVNWFERVQLILRLAPALRKRYND
jgi:hypothetical protein